MKDLHGDYATLDDASSNVGITRAGALYGENELNRRVDEINFADMQSSIIGLVIL
jgi:hypothetical protein